MLKFQINNKIELQKWAVLFTAFCLIILPLNYLIFSLFTNNAAQIAIEVYMHICFVGLLILAGIKFGKWVFLFFIFTFMVVAFSEIQSVYVLRTYEYTGWITSNIFWEYPITIVIGWIYLIYSSYLVTNILILNRENIKGFSSGSHYWPNSPIITQLVGILILAAIDGLILFHIGVINETIGIELGYWNYFANNEPTFFQAPTRTLFTYFIAGFFFNFLFRIIEWRLENKTNNRTQSLNSVDFLPLFPFFLYWGFLIIQALFKFGVNHWAIFVTLPILFLIIVFVTANFLKEKSICT